MLEEHVRGEQDHNHGGPEITSPEKEGTSDPSDEENGMPQQGEPEVSCGGWDTFAHADHLCILAIRSKLILRLADQPMVKIAFGLSKRELPL
ncbi:hypothetical protein NLM31_15845 [Bradyrhizobium sp. CCGUVB4N]|uniref:hypothetical protein n=1 Tax=Bradyrhizobium sp. CCGUVB4N TaxID=2949631 RepID=UPI0020B38FF7|nr:hypothetical protein [Bradyrhizobium sp. CCGUVB4N]MCP3381823.1 hypothetical protein [Bradyrhizobium sp. CCGUVB4N]